MDALSSVLLTCVVLNLLLLTFLIFALEPTFLQTFKAASLFEGHNRQALQAKEATKEELDG